MVLLTPLDTIEFGGEEESEIALQSVGTKVTNLHFSQKLETCLLSFKKRQAENEAGEHSGRCFNREKRNFTPYHSKYDTNAFSLPDVVICKCTYLPVHRIAASVRYNRLKINFLSDRMCHSGMETVKL